MQIKLIRVDKAHYIGCLMFALAIIIYLMYINDINVEIGVKNNRESKEDNLDIYESLVKANSSFVQYLKELDKTKHTPEKREIEFWYKHRPINTDSLLN